MLLRPFQSLSTKVGLRSTCLFTSTPNSYKQKQHSHRIDKRTSVTLQPKPNNENETTKLQFYSRRLPFYVIRDCRLISSSVALSSSNEESSGSGGGSGKDKGKRTASTPIFAKPTSTAKPEVPGGQAGDFGGKKKPVVEAGKIKVKRRMTSTDRNFVTPVRAMQDFLLKSSDLHGLRKTMRRSPHTEEPPITVYWRRDVEQRAEEIWGTFDELKKEKLRRGQQNEEYLDALTNMRRILKKYRREYREMGAFRFFPAFPSTTLLQGSGRIVLAAITINGTNFVIKILAWSMTGSHSLFAEAIHSLADTINQIILAYGIHKSTQRANYDHPYGYANMRHVASLISGVGIFCVGAGLSFYHGITGLVSMEPIESLYWAFYVLAGSLVSEGATLYLAASSVSKRAKALNISFKDFVMRGRDPSLNVVILEDTAAVAGVIVASTCMALSMYTQSPIPDSVGSLIIGGLLGGVASFIIYSNSAALVGRSIPRDSLDQINSELEQDVMIRAIHDVKGIDMGNTRVRYKAEVDFDGRELTRSYLDKQDMKLLLAEIKTVQTNEDLEHFILKHGENIVDTLGAEIDRIETKLMTAHPEIRHCDLEIL